MSEAIPMANLTDSPAIQFTGENYDEIAEFVGPMRYRGNPATGLRIIGPGVMLSVSPGDWVVRNSPADYAVRPATDASA